MKLGILFGFCLFAIRLQAMDLRIATHEWPPFVSSGLKGKGAQAEIVRAAFEARGYGSIHFDILPFTRCVRETAQGHYDAMMPLYMTSERSETFLFSDSYQIVETVFMMRSKLAFSWKKLLDFAPYRIGVVQGYSYGEEFDKAAYLSRIEVGSNRQLLRMLGNERIDAFLIDGPVAQYTLAHDLPHLQGKLKTLSPAYKQNDCRLAVSRKHPKGAMILDDFNRGLQVIRKDGTLEKILARYRRFLGKESP